MPTPSKSVHFQDVDSAVEAYRKAKIVSFALFNGKQLITKFQGENIEDGAQALEWWLQHFDDIKSAAIYTICLYEDVPDKGIKDNTPYDGSFNVRFVDYPIGALPRDVYTQYGGGAMAMYKELQEVKTKLKQLEDEADDEGDDDEDDQPQKRTIGDVVITALEPQIPNLANKLIDLLFPALAKAQQIPAMNGVTASADTTDRTRLDNAIKVLQTDVPDIVEVLEKLAKIAKAKPGDFQLYMKAVRMMEV